MIVVMGSIGDGFFRAFPIGGGFAMVPSSGEVTGGVSAGVSDGDAQDGEEDGVDGEHGIGGGHGVIGHWSLVIRKR